MPAGGNTTITAKFLVLLSPPGTLTLSAHIDPRTGETNTSNNDMSQTTTVSGSVCTTCVDLVAAEMIASPEPVASGGTVTLKWVVVNTGDTPTSLSTNPSDNEQLAFFDFTANGGGAISGVTFAYSAPGVTCTTVGSGTGFRLNDCFGNVGPGQSVVITATVTGVTGSSLFASGTLDPNGKQTEFKETNNGLTQTVVVQ
jgi:hypothetical protein